MNVSEPTAADMENAETVCRCKAERIAKAIASARRGGAWEERSDTRRAFELDQKEGGNRHMREVLSGGRDE